MNARKFGRGTPCGAFATETGNDRYVDVPDFKDPEKFVAAKVKMLKRDMCIPVTDEEIAHLYELKTENDINRAVSQIITNYWG